MVTLKEIREKQKLLNAKPETSLGFGQSKSIAISFKVPNLKESVDLKSRLGFMSEAACAFYLSELIEYKNLSLTPKSRNSEMKKIFISKKREVISLGAAVDEVERMVSAGQEIAKRIYKDLVISEEDLPFLTFDISLTGNSEKGISKADLVLTVTKDSEKIVVDKIIASLKAYKTSSINLSNTTFVSLIKNLFYGNDKNIAGNTEAFILKFVKDFGFEEDIRKLYSYQNIIGNKMKKGATKDQARKIAKTKHGDVIEIITKIFNRHYSKNKKTINSRMLKMLGFEGGEDFYAAIGKAGKQKIISSRQSQELKNVIDKLTKTFSLSIERNGNTKNAIVRFIDPNDDTIIQANMTFADTGGNAPQGKTNLFVNFKDMLK